MCLVSALACCAVMLFGAASAPAKTAGKVIDYAAINADIVAGHLLPRYHAFTEKTAALSAAAEKLCPDVTEASLKATRAAFHDALDAWQEVEHLRQGPPASAETHIRVKFWPDRKNLVDKHLARLMANTNPDILKPEPFHHVSIAVQGFPALERLLFANDAVSKLTSGDGPVRPCGVVRAIAVNLHEIAADLEERWRKDPAEGRDAKRVTTDLFNDLATGLGAAAELKLGAPISSDGKVRAHRAENWISNRSLRNIQHNLFALEDLYDGLAAPAVTGLPGTPEDALIRGQFKQMIKDAQALGPSITEALATEKGPLRIKVLKGGVQDLRELVIVNLAGALELVLGFNALDGD
jgi:predicted lipoprotein